MPWYVVIWTGRASAPSDFEGGEMHAFHAESPGAAITKMANEDGDPLDDGDRFFVAEMADPELVEVKVKVDVNLTPVPDPPAPDKVVEV